MYEMSAVTINWTGPQLTHEQQVIIHDAALNFDSEHAEERLVFAHPLCDGVIECKGRMLHGAFHGTRFIATLDGVDGERRIYEFLLTDYYKRSSREKVKSFWRHAVGTDTAEVTDADVIKKTRTSSAKRSRLN